uniref:Ig-like domain-containing protein n=3 Tax=Anabas testudineus TaxID=64144 RepID=A0A7N6BBW9_ANATE
MIVLICVTLLFSVRSSNADTGASLQEFCQGPYCITLPKREITAEAGLCVVIPCSFSTSYYFTSQYIVWSKCEPTESRCGQSDIIFDSDENNRNILAGFMGRVSLLESDVSEKNCSIVINDLRESDSGSYQLRVNGLYLQSPDRLTFSKRATVSVTGLSQKPTVTVPPLIEGHQTTLTCTAPGLCSGSVPEITWTWRKPGVSDSHMPGNITEFRTENLTAVTQRHSSTLTFNTSAEHHDTEVTCKVNFKGDTTTEETVTLNVTYIKEVKITGNTSVKEGETLNLTCTVDSFPPSLVTWTGRSIPDVQNGTEMNLQNDTLTDLHNVTEPFLQEENGKATFSLTNITTKDSGQYICTVKHLNNTLKKQVDVTVIYVRSPLITGNMTVEEGDALNLTCSVDSFPRSFIKWTKLGFNTTLHSGTDTDLQNNTGSATLFMPNVTEEQAGRYMCTVKHLDTTLTLHADVTVTWFPKILNSSRCEVQSDVLTCVCISVLRFPLPTIRWPLLENYTEYSVITTVSNHTVNSTLTLVVKDHANRSVECVASNTNGEVKKNLKILKIQKNLSQQEENGKTFLKIASQLETIIAFLIGVLMSTVLCCLVNNCHRKKQKGSGHLDETLQMVSNQDDPLIYDGPAVEDDQLHFEEGAEDEAVTVEKIAPKLQNGPKDVEYASIDFTRLKKKREAAKRETTKTEYAEVKREVEEERAEIEMLEDKEEEAEMEEDEETQHWVPEEDEGEDMAVYSTVKDIMDKT